MEAPSHEASDNLTLEWAHSFEFNFSQMKNVRGFSFFFFVDIVFVAVDNIIKKKVVLS